MIARLFSTAYVLRAGLLLCLAWQGVVQAKPVLEYELADWRQSPPMPVQESAFHGWAGARQDAEAIVKSWNAGEPVTVPWTRVQLGRYVKHKIMPTRGARGLALVHVAMHDALELAQQQQVQPRLAVSAAAARVLAYLFPAEESNFQRIAFAVAAQISGTEPQKLGAEAKQALLLGDLVGRRVVMHAESDGAQRGWNGVRLQWYGDGRYYGPGSWEPTPPYFYYPPDEPFAPTWRTWVLSSAGQFRPVPPVFGSARYMRDLQEVVDIDRNRTPRQLEIAKYWVDGYGSWTPPGHWNDLAIGLVLKQPAGQKMDDAVVARLFMQMNVALADGFIACWDAKYHYWTVRPITAAKQLLGVDLKPPILTPPFPSYVSGHATFSGAAARVLGHYFPAESKRLDGMADEAAHSRLLGAIHFRHDNEDGLVLGRKIGSLVLEKLN